MPRCRAAPRCAALRRAAPPRCVAPCCSCHGVDAEDVFLNCLGPAKSCECRQTPALLSSHPVYLSPSRRRRRPLAVPLPRPPPAPARAAAVPPERRLSPPGSTGRRTRGGDDTLSPRRGFRDFWILSWSAAPGRGGRWEVRGRHRRAAALGVGAASWKWRPAPLRRRGTTRPSGRVPVHRGFPLLQLSHASVRLRRRRGPSRLSAPVRSASWGTVEVSRLSSSLFPSLGLTARHQQRLKDL